MMKGGSHSKTSTIWPVRPESKAFTATDSVALVTVPVTPLRSKRSTAGWLSAARRQPAAAPMPRNEVLFQVALARAVSVKLPLLVTTVSVGRRPALAAVRPWKSSGQALPRDCR